MQLFQQTEPTFRLIATLIYKMMAPPSPRTFAPECCLVKKPRSTDIKISSKFPRAQPLQTTNHESRGHLCHPTWCKFLSYTSSNLSCSQSLYQFATNKIHSSDPTGSSTPKLANTPPASPPQQESPQIPPSPATA